MPRSIVIAFLVLVAACGGGSSTSGPTTPIVDPIPMVEQPTGSTPGVELVTASEPATPAPAAAEPAKATAEEDVKPPVEGHDTGRHDHGSPPEVSPAPTKKKAPRAAAAAPTRIDIVVTKAGFEPKNVTVPRGKPVVLRFERRVDRTCGTEVVMVVGGKTIEKDLPLNTPVELAITFPTAGTVKYSCSMDMIRGTITVRE